MKLHNYWRSSASWRVRIALHHKELPFEYVPVQIVEKQQQAPGYTAMNPLAQVPTLELDEGGRAIYLAQSLAIMEYLEERYPEKRLYPTDRADRALARQLAEVVNAGIQPFQNLPVLGIVKDELGGDAQAFARRFNARGLEAIEALSARRAGRFLIGDAPTVADVCLVPQMYSARRFGVDVQAFPTLVRIEAACNELGAFAAAHPDAQPDAPKS
jgi:maleylpyruvate isomerase